MEASRSSSTGAGGPGAEVNLKQGFALKRQGLFRASGFYEDLATSSLQMSQTTPQLDLSRGHALCFPSSEASMQEICAELQATTTRASDTACCNDWQLTSERDVFDVNISLLSQLHAKNADSCGLSGLERTLTIMLMRV